MIFPQNNPGNPPDTSGLPWGMGGVQSGREFKAGSGGPLEIFMISGLSNTLSNFD